MASAGCAGLLFARVDVKDLPQTDYEITRYTSGTRGVAIILDDPNDDVLLTFGTDKFRTKKEGLKPPQRYLKQFMGSPKAYQLQDKETEQVLGYLLISWELEWLVHYNRGGRKVSICIEDPYAGGGNGGE
jgi:hypothetical protein